MNFRVIVLGLSLGVGTVVGACVGDDNTQPKDGGSDATTAPDVEAGGGDGGGGGCDGGMLCSNACVDTTTDPKNCGRCAHDCALGQCEAGVCQPALVANAIDAGVITSVTTDQSDDNPASAAQHVFWSVTGVGGGVFQDNTIGGNTITLSTSTAVALTNVVVNQTTAYWFIANFGGPQQPVLKAQVGSAGSQASLGTMNGNAIQSILYEPTSQYVWGSYAANGTTHGAFKCAPGTGVVCTSVTTVTGQPGGDVATDGTHMYFCDPNNGIIEQVAFTGSVSTFLNGQATPNLLRVDGTSLYWFNSGTKTVERTILPSATPKQLASTTSAANALAADSVNVYWTESASGTINFAPITGGGPNAAYVTMGATANPMHLVRDTRFLYFSHGSSIYRVALP